MRTQTIRTLDYWLGVPACAALTAVRRLTGHRRQPARRVAFIKFIEQGATVLAQDAVARAIDRVGRENVFFCVFETNRAILDVLGLVPPDNVLWLRDRTVVAFAVDFIRILWRMRRERIDAVIDMEFFSRASAVFAFLSGATTRAGLHRFTGELPYRGDLMTHRVQYNPHLHISAQYAMLTEAALGTGVDEPLLKVPAATIDRGHRSAAFTPTAEEVAQMRALIAEAGDRPGPTILLNPNASDLLPLRKWGRDRFEALAQRLLTQFPDARLVITGAPDEREAAEAMCRSINSPRVVSAAGRTSLRDLLTLYVLSNVLVTNDSGPAHFASLTDIHTVVLFGPETPHLFGSRASNTTIVWKQLACSPCVSVFNHRLSPCTNNVCMQLITVDDVCAAVTGAITR